MSLHVVALQFLYTGTRGSFFSVKKNKNNGVVLHPSHITLLNILK